MRKRAGHKRDLLTYCKTVGLTSINHWRMILHFRFRSSMVNDWAIHVAVHFFFNDNHNVNNILYYTFRFCFKLSRYGKLLGLKYYQGLEIARQL